LNKQANGTALFVIALFAVQAASYAQPPGKGIVRSLSEVKFEQDGDVKCLASAVESGNPATGPSTIILKAPPKCLVPWHYHTAAEQLIVVEGKVLTEMDGMPAHALAPGGFAMMPGKVHHQFACQSTSPCILYVTFDRTYDIFWVKDEKKAGK